MTDKIKIQVAIIELGSMRKKLASHAMHIKAYADEITRDLELMDKLIKTLNTNEKDNRQDQGA